MTTHNKQLFVNATGTSLTTANGSKANVPEFFYKDSMLLNFVIQDSSGDPIDLTGATYELKMAATYNGTPLVTVSNSDFIATDPANGLIACNVNMNQAAILAYISPDASKTAHVSLWAVISGTNYCLASFSVIINNLVF
jgi:hypothetical protein